MPATAPLPRLARLMAPLAVALGATCSAAADDAAWQVVGQQGLVRFVIVPAAHVVDLPAYEEQIARLCEPEHTCFLNFYVNPTGATARLPLPDAIANEATATFRRSAKNGITFFLWSCRLKVPGRECF